jgi:uncharacterized RDD family membrane protein YckC
MIGSLGWQELFLVGFLFLAAPLALVVGLIAGGRRATDPVERFYSEDELQTASPRRRLGAYLLDGLIATFTVWIGWLVWFAFVAPRGQTPGKQLLSIYVLRDDGTRAGGGYMWLRELLMKSVVFGVVSFFTLYIGWIIAALWCVWDRDRQCLWDKLVSTYVAYSPLGVRPKTRAEIALTGSSLPIATPRGAGAAQSAPNVADALRELKQLLDDGILTPDEYQARRGRLVERL